VFLDCLRAEETCKSGIMRCACKGCPATCASMISTPIAPRQVAVLRLEEGDRTPAGATVILPEIGFSRVDKPYVIAD
jgi:hypothetical protein